MIETIHKRRSIRKYQEKPIDEETILKIIDCGRLAPSDSNTQPWNFIIVRSLEMRTRLAHVCHEQDWMLSAPVFLVCVADIRVTTNETGPLQVDEDTPGIGPKQIILDTAIAGENMVLAAESMGLGTCWVTWYVQKDIRPVLGIPEDKYVVAVITLGYPDQTPKQRPRRSLDEVIRYERWD